MLLKGFCIPPNPQKHSYTLFSLEKRVSICIIFDAPKAKILGRVFCAFRFGSTLNGTFVNKKSLASIKIEGLRIFLGPAEMPALFDEVFILKSFLFINKTKT